MKKKVFDEIVSLKTTKRVLRLKKKVFEREGSFFERELLWAEAYQKNRQESSPELRQAQALKYLLEKMTIEIGEDELIVGRHPRRIPSASEQEKFKETTKYLENRTIGGWEWEGHITLNNERILREGLDGIRKRAEKKLKRLRPGFQPEDVEKELFYRSAIIALESASCFIERHVKKAEKMAEKETNPLRKRELKSISKVCRNIAYKPASSFYEAIQLVWFVHLMVCAETSNFHACFCQSGFDQYLYPYYKRDLREKRINIAQAQELIDHFLLKMNEFGIRTLSIQMLMIGGKTPQGKDASNELSLMCLRAMERLGLREPSFSLRWHPQISERIMLQACKMLANGLTYPAIFNDEVIIPGLLQVGVQREDAYSYNPGSCIEITVSGKSRSYFVADYLNLAKTLLLTLEEESFKTFSDLLKAYKRQISHLVRDNALSVNRQQNLIMRWARLPLLSCFIDDCIEKGKDYNAGGARYTFTEPQGVGMPTVVDSLLVIRKLIFEQKRMPLVEFRKILQKDFKEKEVLRQEIINHFPKYGTDNDEADELAVELINYFCDEVKKYKPAAGGKYHPGFLAWQSYFSFGKETGATPDGRRAKTPLSDSMAPVQGQGRKGPTAIINSVTKFNHIGILGGLVLNLKFTPSALQGEDGVEKLKNILTTYLKKGGFQVQVNVIDEKALREAQEYPERYRDLKVRVSGYSAYFTDLSREQQNEIIARIAHEG